MIQYRTVVGWDRTLVALEFVEDDAVTRKAGIAGLVNYAVKITTGAPAATAGKFMKAAQIQNAVDGTWYENTGTTASPTWSLVPSSGSGITQLTGDVTAGPGSGSQAATIAANAVTTAKILNGAVTTAKIAANSVDGTKIALTSQATGSIMYYNGTDWVVLVIGTAGQVLTVNGGATAPVWA